MAAGQPIGEYSLKATSLTLTPGPGGSVLVQANYEGTSVVSHKFASGLCFYGLRRL
jgi:hypothetical protein